MQISGKILVYEWKLRDTAWSEEPWNGKCLSKSEMKNYHVKQW